MGRKRFVMNRYKLGRKVGTTENRKDFLVNYLISFTVNLVIMVFFVELFNKYEDSNDFNNCFNYFFFNLIRCK